MRILISGVCGFAGRTLAGALRESAPGREIFGFDNFIRPGSETSRAELKRLGVKVFHADLRAASDIEALPPSDWVIDAAANASVLAGVDGQASSRQLVEHNLGGTVNLLEYCKRHRAGFILLSTSRVYSIAALAALPLETADQAFRPAAPVSPGRDGRPGLSSSKGPRPSVFAELRRDESGQTLGTSGASPAGLDETFSTQAPVSLYGATKLASEALALEYGEAFDLPVFINRCGVLAGAGQFGRADQGIFAYWINSWLRKRPLKYIGFGGHGHQVRDCLHPRDLASLLDRQMAAARLAASDRLVHAGGGLASAISLRQLSDWCAGRFGAHAVAADPALRAFDVPWLVLDCAKAERLWQWRPATGRAAILEEIAAHAQANPGWLDLSAPF